MLAIPIGSLDSAVCKPQGESILLFFQLLSRADVLVLGLVPCCQLVQQRLQIFLIPVNAVERWNFKIDIILISWRLMLYSKMGIYYTAPLLGPVSTCGLKLHGYLIYCTRLLAPSLEVYWPLLSIGVPFSGSYLSFLDWALRLSSFSSTTPSDANEVSPIKMFLSNTDEQQALPLFHIRAK